MTYSTIKPKKKPCKCGKHEGYLFSHGYTKECWAKVKPQKPIKKVSEKQKVKIQENKEYYSWAIGSNIIKNKGVCRCDECGQEIKKPTGRNVCHIVSGGANEALYKEKVNHFILGKGEIFNECGCGKRFDEGPDQEGMKIWKEAQERKTTLKAKYYGRN